MTRHLAAALVATLLLAACEAGDPVDPLATDDETEVEVTPTE